MSETSSSQQRAESCGPACEGDVLIIEVLGKDHPKGHAFRIYDDTDNEQQEWLENRVEVEEADDTVLHVWPWRGQPKRNVWLEIEAAEGAPIRVPFLEGATKTERQLERQHHVILPVLPTTLVSGVTLRQDNPVHHVMARPGFLYLFHQGKLWRELEIRQDEEGQTTFHDVALWQYRRVEGFTPGSRAVTGTPLKEIWLPARTDSRWLSLEAAYSETQWPAPRINYLENNARPRRERCNTIHMEMAPPGVADGNTISHGTGRSHAFPVSYLAPQRSRKPGLEWQFDHPGNYLKDLQGAYAASSHQTAFGIHQRQEDPDPEDPIYEDERPEMTPLALCLHRTLDEVGQQCTREPFPSGHWQAGGPVVEDCVKTARDRQIGAIQLDDQVYRLRYLQQRRLVANWFAEASGRRARHRPYFDSALLLNTVMVPPKIGGDTNPLHKFMSELSGSGRAELERSVAGFERKMAQQYLHQLQEDLNAALSQDRVQHTLVDFFTLDGYDYAGAFHFVSGLIQDLVTEPRECDALALSGEPAPDGPGKQWLRGLCEQKHSPVLYALLFPRSDAGALEAPYQPPVEPEENRGDGRFRGSELASLENADLPELEGIQTLHGLELVAAAEQGAFNTLMAASLRTGSGVLMSVHGNLWSAIHNASQTLSNNDPRLKAYQQQEKQLNRQMADLKGRQQALREERNATSLDNERVQSRITRQLEQLDVEESNLIKTEQEVAIRKQALQKQAIQAQMKLYSGSIQQLRASMPELLGELRLERLSKALQKDYLVIGMPEQLTQGQRAIRMFGDLIKDGDDASEAVASTNRKRAAAKGVPFDQADDVYVLVVPRTVKVAEMIAELTDAETRVALARKALDQTSNLVNASEATGAVAVSRLASAQQELQAANEEFERVARRFDKTGTAIRELEATNDAARQSINDTGSSRIYRMLNTPVLPAFVLLMEGINLRSVITSAQKDFRQRGFGRTSAGIFSAGYDFLIAGTLLTERFGQNLALVAKISDGLSYQFSSRFAQIMEQKLGGPVVLRAFLGAVAGFVMAGISISDAIHALHMGNVGAAVGHGLLAASGVALGVSGLMGEAGVLLALGPKGWLVLGVLLALSGAGLVWWNNDAPLETWMRHGPFGPLAELPFLKEPDEAYYRLISLLVGVSVRLGHNPLRDKALRGELKDDNEKRLAAIREANTCLTIESAIPGLFEGARQMVVEPYLQLAEEHVHMRVTSRDGMPTRTTRAIDDKAELEKHVLWEESTGSGVQVYLSTPPTRSTDNMGWFNTLISTDIYKYSWHVRIQVRIQEDENARPMVFPAPLPEDPLTYNPENEEHTEPDFREKEQPFWYHEQVSIHG